MILQSPRYIVSVVTFRLSVLHSTLRVLGSDISCAYNVSIIVNHFLFFEESALLSVVLPSNSADIVLKQNVTFVNGAIPLYILYSTVVM
jgi:hypothetical protein